MMTQHAARHARKRLGARDNVTTLLKQGQETRKRPVFPLHEYHAAAHKSARLLCSETTILRTAAPVLTSTSSFHGLKLRSFSSLLDNSLEAPSKSERKSDKNVKNSSALHSVVEKLRSRSTAEHLACDAEHLWHPYTSLTSEQRSSFCLPVAFAQGTELHLETGHCLLDGMSSWWSVVHGYNHPQINQVMQEQMSKFSHVMFGGLTHRPATELAELLLHVTGTPPSRTGKQGQPSERQLTKIFFADSGSVSVEVALKMSLQYQRGRGYPDRTRFVTPKGGYHGDTFGAMSVCDPVNGMHSEFQANLMDNLFVTRPPLNPKTRLTVDGDASSGSGASSYQEDLEQACLDMEHTLATHGQHVAAVILEPLVQGAGGMYFYAPEYLHRVRSACDAHGILLICDEIATGFGRTGLGRDTNENDAHGMFAFQTASIEPDILCLGKALTGGYLTMGVTMTTAEVAEGVSAIPPSSDDASLPAKSSAMPLMHGPTFMANPLACSAAVASLSLLLSPLHKNANAKLDASTKIGPTPMWRTQVPAIHSVLRSSLQPAAYFDNVADVRVMGAIGVIELTHSLTATVEDRQWVAQQCLDLGVWLRPFGKLLYTMPPYVMTEEEVRKVAEAMVTVADRARERGKSNHCGAAADSA